MRQAFPACIQKHRGGGRAEREAIAVYAQGILNIMSMLQMRPVPYPVKQPTHHLWGDGNLDYLIAAQSAGLFESETELLADVQAGQRLGCVRDVYGREQSEVVSPRDGVLLLLPTYTYGDGGRGIGICHRSLCRYLNTRSNRLAGQAGACRFVWNHFLSRQQQEYAA